MDIDRKNKVQLNDELGYDGGAFFNKDATKIVWRAYHPKTAEETLQYKNLPAQNSIRPMALKIWTMNSDGTNSGAANFRPYFFPSGDKIVFSSNLHDPKGRDFDLFSTNSDGSDLERITF